MYPGRRWKDLDRRKSVRQGVVLAISIDIAYRIVYDNTTSCVQLPLPRRDWAMRAFRNKSRPQYGWLLVCGVVFISLLISAGPLQAQPVGDTDAVNQLVEDRVQPSEPSPWHQIDSGFEKIVDTLARVLFYRLGTRSQTYVQFDEKQNYVRLKGDPTPFLRLTNGVLDPTDPLSDAEIERLQVLGELELRTDGGAIRTGTWKGKAVEFVARSLRTSKYVFQEGEFRRVLTRRQLLSREDVLIKSQVEAAAAKGALAVDPDRRGQPNDYLLHSSTGGIPFVVLWLALGAVFFTFYMRFVNFWAFRHALEVVRGKFDNPQEPGEVTHFQALASALSATVGLGNIAGVTIAMTLGGPGAFFWMMACGFFGMTSKFVECTLGQRYRSVKEDGTVLGGPMQYLNQGLAELGLKPLGVVMSVLFAVMCILASFGGGNMFQANQSGQQMLAMFQQQDYAQLEELNAEIKQAAANQEMEQLAELQAIRSSLQNEMKRFSQKFLPVFGSVLAIMVAMVIIGGIKRIGATASKIVPSMCLIYIAACLWIILVHASQVPALFAQIFTEAFHPKAFGGGLLGILVVGVQRAAFSNEAGVGSASIAHSAAKTDEPVREGIVALLGPFIDTVVVCSMTALVILITGAWNNEAWVVEQGLVGTPLTSKAFAQEIHWFPYVLSIAVFLFAYSTIISWSYYGERCWERLFGARSTVIYKLIYVAAAFLGAIVNLGSVLDFSDMMILSMAFPNVLGLLLLSPKVRRDLIDYWDRLQAGQFRTFS